MPAGGVVRRRAFGPESIPATRRDVAPEAGAGLARRNPERAGL